MMWPDASFIELLVWLVFWDSDMPLPEHVAMRVANHATDEQRKKKKDNKEKKWRSKQRGKHYQGLSEEEEEEEEEEEDDGSEVPIP